MRGYLFVAACGILSGTVTFGGRVLSDLGVSLFEISIYRYAIGALVLLPFVWNALPILRRKWKPLIVLGLVGAALGLSEIAAVVLGAPVALAAFLIYSQPLWTVFLSWLILGEQPTLRKILALVIALCGVIILFQPWKMQAIGSLSGALLGLLAGMLLSLYIILIRKTHFDEIPSLLGTFGWLIFSLFWFIVFYPLVSLVTRDPALVSLRTDISPTAWLLIFVFAMTAEVLPAVLLFKGSQTVEASLSGIVLLLEPVSAALLAVVFLHEAITGNILLGGLLVLAANVVTASRRPAISGV